MESGGEIERPACPYLGRTIELTEERERHIAAQPPELLPRMRARTAAAIDAPNVVRRSARRPTARLFSCRYEDGDRIRPVVVVVESEMAGGRNWIVTAYVTRRLTGGIIEWRRS